MEIFFISSSRQSTSAPAASDNLRLHGDVAPNCTPVSTRHRWIHWSFLSHLTYSRSNFIACCSAHHRSHFFALNTAALLCMPTIPGPAVKKLGVDSTVIVTGGVPGALILCGSPTLGVTALDRLRLALVEAWNPPCLCETSAAALRCAPRECNVPACGSGVLRLLEESTSTWLIWGVNVVADAVLVFGLLLAASDVSI